MVLCFLFNPKFTSKFWIKQKNRTNLLVNLWIKQKNRKMAYSSDKDKKSLKQKKLKTKKALAYFWIPELKQAWVSI